ncbi:MAG: copper chaperone PCu(A)C [Rhodospirillaceae bacterium]|nr:copper chaperone PCu(A)C [Rhodospirillaceae bacterium]
MVVRIAIMCFLSLSFPAFASNDTGRSGPIVVERAWARATTINVSAAYATLRNAGTAADRLIRVSSPVARRVEIHNVVDRNGIVSMVPVKVIVVSPEEPSVLRPGGLHIMLMGLKQKLVKGQTIPLTFTFRTAGAINVDAVVAKHGARKAPPPTN